MTALTSNYGVGVANRFMLLEDEEAEIEINEPEQVVAHKQSNQKVSKHIHEDRKGAKESTKENQSDDKVAKHKGKSEETHKREFDRHSGSNKTGVKAVDKKGAGSYNWGSTKDQALAETNDLPDDEEWDKPEIVPPTKLGLPGITASQKATDTANYINKSLEGLDVCESNDNPIEEIEAVSETLKEPVQLTLDEWKALHSGELSKPEYKIRQPGEGEDASKWKGTYVVHKAGQDPKSDEVSNKHHVSNKRDGASTSYGSHSNAAPSSSSVATGGKKVLDINVKYKSPFTNNDRGGFRGGPRGGPGTFGRGGSRGGPSGNAGRTFHNNSSSSPSNSYQPGSGPSPVPNNYRQQQPHHMSEHYQTNNNNNDGGFGASPTPHSDRDRFGLAQHTDHQHLHEGSEHHNQQTYNNDQPQHFSVERGGFRPLQSSGYNGPPRGGRGGFNRGSGNFRGGRGGFGGRGGPFRGGRGGNQQGGGGMRHGGPGDQQPVFNAETDFPSLRTISAK